jgi:hypothetical protein
MNKPVRFIFVRSLHDMHEMNAERDGDVCLSVHLSV